MIAVKGAFDLVVILAEYGGERLANCVDRRQSACVDGVGSKVFEFNVYRLSEPVEQEIEATFDKRPGKPSLAGEARRNSNSWSASLRVVVIPKRDWFSPNIRLRGLGKNGLARSAWISGLSCTL